MGPLSHLPADAVSEFDTQLIDVTKGIRYMMTSEFDSVWCREKLKSVDVTRRGWSKDWGPVHCRYYDCPRTSL